MSTVSGTVHSNRTAVVLLHKRFSSDLAFSVIIFWLSIFCKYISIITNHMYVNISVPNIKANVKNSFTFSKSVYYL
jgi:hypothetical protein